MSQAARSCSRTTGRRFLRPVARYRSRCGRTLATWPTATGPAFQRAAPLMWPEIYQNRWGLPTGVAAKDFCDAGEMQAGLLGDITGRETSRPSPLETFTPCRTGTLSLAVGTLKRPLRLPYRSPGFLLRIT